MKAWEKKKLVRKIWKEMVLKGNINRADGGWEKSDSTTAKHNFYGSGGGRK